MRIKTKQSRVPSRPVPDDFDIIFVEKGRFECEAWYRAGRIMVNRWLEERGKTRLIRKRAAFVKLERQSRTGKDKAPQRIVIRPSKPVEPAIAKAAADHLRTRRHGGWMISPYGEGLWRVGVAVKAADDMVRMAERTGFDRRAIAVALEAGGGLSQ